VRGLNFFAALSFFLQDRFEICTGLTLTECDNHSVAGSLRRGYRVNGEFRAEDLAVMAVHALIGLRCLGRVIAFFVKAVGEGEHMHRAELNAVATAFASVFDNDHPTFGDADLLSVQGLSPECHNGFLKKN
jgi:hypothetical protein